MVVRMAPQFGYKPHEVWAFPFGFYKTLRDAYIDMVRPPKPEQGDLGTLTPDRLDQLAEEGITDIDFDQVIRKRQKGR